MLRTCSRGWSRLPGAAALLAVPLVFLLLAPRHGHAFDFEWLGKIELDAEGLRSPDATRRREAVAALGKYDIAITAPYLIEALRDPDLRVRAEAGRLLGKHKVAEAVPIVIEWLNEPDPAIKQEAAAILADLGTEQAVAALVRSLGDPDDAVRERAAMALGAIGSDKVVVPLIGRLEDDKSDVRKAAIEQLARLGDRRAVIPLAGAFTDPNLEVRKAAIAAVGHLHDPAPIPALLRLLRDPVEEIKQAAVTSLGNLHAAAAIDELIAELDEGSDSYRSKVAYALGRIARHAGQDAAGQGGNGSDAAASTAAADRAVRALVEALSRQAVRAAASEALRHAGEVAVPALVAHLDGEIEGDLHAVVELLRDIGDARATPALVTELDRGRIGMDLLLEALGKTGDDRALMPVLRLLSSEDADMRLAAMIALEPLIRDARAADVLAGMVGDPNLEIRVMAVEYLGLMRATSAVPRLIELAGPGHRPRLRRAAVDALGEIGDARAADALLDILVKGPRELAGPVASALIYIGAPTLVPRLLDIARSGHDSGQATSLERRREHAVRALGGVLRDRRHDEARAALEELARSEGTRISLSAIEALGAMGDKASVAVLTELSGRDSHRRRAAITALGNVGDSAAVPVLLQALDASDDRVSGDAAWALAKIADARALDALARASRRRGWATAINASAALARYAPASHAGALADLLYHRNRLVRANAAMGLGRVHAGAGARVPAQARRALSLALQKDASWLVRVSAARAMSRITGFAGELDQARALDRDERVREAARLALVHPFAPVARSDWRSFYFVDPDRDDAPVRQEPYFLTGSDGLVTALYTDARGMAGDEEFPPGDAVLEPRSKIVRY